MLSFRDLNYRIGGRMLLDGANAQVPTGRKIGLVGRNGTGKSTLLRLVAGAITPTAGRSPWSPAPRSAPSPSRRRPARTG